MNRKKEEIELVDSPSIDEGNGGSVGVGGGILKKGPWTGAEDAILVDYVRKHGEGNWNAVQKYSGLSRCGKSCRLRWANHLRPNLKKGAITQEEERLIIELHARMGNKWARMASSLPGRTDNEIKNYWNTRIKRRQRANLPLYPPEMCFDENILSQDVGEYSSSIINKQRNEVFQGNTYDIYPNGLFNNYRVDQGPISYPWPLPVSSLLAPGFSPKTLGVINPAGNRLKRFRDSETSFSGVHGGIPTFENYSTEKIHRCFGSTYPYDPDPGSHALNGNFSTLQPFSRAVKLELPSLQYQETDEFSWPSTPPMDAYLQSPSVQSDHVPTRNSGLLDALVHSAEALSSTRSHQSEQSPSPVQSSALHLGDEFWDPTSPLGLTAASIFSETPPISGSSLDEFSPTGSDVMLANADLVSTPSIGESRSDFTRPDALLGSKWPGESLREQDILNDALATLLSDDICEDLPSSESASSSMAARELGFDSFSWNNLADV